MNPNQTQTSPPSSMIPSSGSLPLNNMEQLIALGPAETLEIFVASQRNLNTIPKVAPSSLLKSKIKLREAEILMAIKCLEYRIGLTDDSADIAALTNMQVIIQTRWHLPGEFLFVMLQSLRMLWSWHMDRYCKLGHTSSRHMLDELDHFINRLNNLTA